MCVYIHIYVKIYNKFCADFEDKMSWITFKLIEWESQKQQKIFLYLFYFVQVSTKPNEQHTPWSSVVTLCKEQNTLISLSQRTCTSANVLFWFKPKTTARSLKWHMEKPMALLRIPPAASFRSAVRRHKGPVVHNTRSGCLLPSSLWQYIKYVKSFGSTSF